MSFKKICICLILIFCIIGAASAADDVSADVVDASADAVAVDAVPEDVSDSVESTVVEDEPVVDDSAPAQYASDEISGQPLSIDDSYVIYVDEKGDSENGDGTIENPFTTLDSACISVNEYKNEVTVNISDGTYKIGDELKFNTAVLNINGMGSNVILKNLYDTTTAKQSFGLIESNNGKFTMTNIIFDASDWHQKNSKARCFSPFNNGDNNQVNFINCTFIGFNDNNVILPHSNDELNNYNNYTFTNCKFANFTNQMHMGNAIKCDVSFINCIFSAKFENGLGMEESNNVTFDRCWFGYNDFNDNRMFTNLNTISGEITPRYGMSTGLYKFTKYAIFDISENYLGDNKYEIIGKLMWNDSTTDDIDKLGVMTVNLNSNTGDLNQTTAILENGIFKVLYTSTSSNHNISAVLDNQQIDLIFTNIDMSLNAPIINYGEDQNITVTLPQAVYGTVTVLVDGIPYTANIENDNSIVIPITDTLSSGSHNVNVTFIDEENHVYAFNTTTITVNAVSNYDFDVTVPEITAGEATTTTIKLPEDATGNITVTIDGEVSSVVNLTNGIATITIPELSAGNHEVVISYSGDGKYDGFSQSSSVTVKEPVTPTKLTADKVTATYNVAKKLVITLKDANGNVLANKKVTVKVGTISKTLTTNAKGQVSLNVATLVPKTYTATVKFAGDDAYLASSVSPKVVVSKAKPKITAKAKTFKVKVKTKKYIVTLKNNKGKVMKKVKLTLKVGKKTYKATTNAKGKATFKITKLTKKGKYTATVKFAGNKYFKALSKKVKITVKK